MTVPASGLTAPALTKVPNRIVSHAGAELVLVTHDMAGGTALSPGHQFAGRPDSETYDAHRGPAADTSGEPGDAAARLSAAFVAMLIVTMLIVTMRIVTSSRIAVDRAIRGLTRVTGHETASRNRGRQPRPGEGGDNRAVPGSYAPCTRTCQSSPCSTSKLSRNTCCGSNRRLISRSRSRVAGGKASCTNAALRSVSKLR